MSKARLNSEESVEYILMSAGSSKTVLLIHVHLGTLLFATSICEVSNFVKLLLKLVVTFAFEGESQVSRVSLEASKSPLALGSISSD